MNDAFMPPAGRGELMELPPQEAAPEQSHIDLMKLWSAVYRNRYIILGIVALALVAGFTVTLLTRPQYRASATVQIEQQTAKVLESEDSEPGGAAFADADRFLQTQLDILKSRSLAEKVADSLGLARDNRFVTAMGAKPVERPIGSYDLRTSRREQVVGMLMANMSADLPRNSRIASISFMSPDPVLAARIANSFAENFITANLQRRYDMSGYARSFLERRLADVRDRLQQSERAMIDYARSAQLIDASNGVAASPNGADSGAAGPRSLTVSRLVQLSNALTQAQTVRLAAEERWNQAKATPLMNLPEVLSNPAIQQLGQQRAQLVASYQEERQRRKDDYPTMIQAAARIKEFDKQIQTLAQSIKSSIQDAYQTALRQEQALTGDVGTLKGATLTEQDRSIRYNILRRDVDTNRALYDGLLQRYKEVSAQAGITTNNISVIDRADTPVKPTRPRPMVNLAVALLLGSIVSGAAVFLREKFDDVIRSPDDVPAKLGYPLLATIPFASAGRAPLEDLDDVRSDFSEAYQALRVTIELSTAGGVPKVLFVTSSRPSEGKSTTAFAIARNFARVGKKVVIVDADMRKPSLHRMLGFANNVGLSSLLARQKPLDDVIQASHVERLDFIPSGPLPPNPSELLSSAVLDEAMARMAQVYDLIVLDGPPIMGLADAAQLAAVANGTVFVVEAAGGHYGVVKTGIRRLLASRTRILGVVLTKFDFKQLGYGYGYGYSYSYKYGDRKSE